VRVLLEEVAAIWCYHIDTVGRRAIFGKVEFLANTDV
jgi:hypothetical protein